MNNLSTLKNRNPIHILKNWLKEAEEHSQINQPKAMVLSSFNVNSNNKPKVSSRIVLLKEIQKEHLIFYTNYKSLKSNQLKNSAALNFYWSALGKQIRLEGKANKTNRAQSLQYWKTRPRESQISQYISKQSSTLKNRSLLEKTWEKTQKQFHGKEIPCPLHWGGFSFRPVLIEFWVEKPYRLHERLLFTKKSLSALKWEPRFLYP